MTARRSRAYGRIIRGLDSVAASQRMTAAQRDVMREAADTLVLSAVDDLTARLALADARAILLGLQGNASEPWIEQLADDLEDTGPAQ